MTQEDRGAELGGRGIKSASLFELPESSSVKFQQVRACGFVEFSGSFGLANPVFQHFLRGAGYLRSRGLRQQRRRENDACQQR